MRALKIRKSGFFKDEEDDLLRFCLNDDYPRSITIERTGTTYTVGHPKAARFLWRNIKGLGHREKQEEYYFNNQQDYLVMNDPENMARTRERERAPWRRKYD